jgi:hypothetical protein
MNLEQRPGESDLAYHKRLVYGKLVDKTLADADYSELTELIYGQKYSSDVARRMMYGSCKTLQLVDDGIASAAPDSLLSELDAKRIELKKEQQKFFDQRSAYNKLLRERARQEELNELLVEAIKSGDLPRLEYTPRRLPMGDNDLLVSLNDIHYGANVDNHWNTYNSDVCREMMRRYLDQIIQIAETHGSENCIVWSNGDAISGNIHQSIAVTNKENVIDQIKGVSELIAEFVAELSSHFSKVVFASVAGNHSRLTPNKDNALLSERLDDLIEWYLAARLQNFQNVEVGKENSEYTKIDHTMYLIDVRGKTYCGVHGDFEGTPQKVQALQTMARRPLYAILSGHLHHNELGEVQGVKTVMAGSFLGMDDYCVQKRIYGEAEQMVCVCDANGIRCSYGISLS